MLGHVRYGTFGKTVLRVSSVSSTKQLDAQKFNRSW